MRYSRSLRPHRCSFNIFNKWFTASSQSRGSLDNVAATKLLKQMYTEHKPSKYQSFNEEKVRQAFDIYDSVHQSKNNYLVNTLLKLLLHFKHSHRGIAIWDEIKDVANFDYSLMIKCCVHSFKNQRARCLEILNAIHQSVHNDNIAVKSSLIHGYGACGDIDSAWSVFNSIPNHHKNVICISAMQRTCIDHEQSEHALELYDEFTALNNEYTHLLALKACIESDQREKGEEIIAINNCDESIQFKTAKMDFYGHFHDINNAFKVFHSILDKDKDAICIGSMLKALVNAGYDEETLSLYDNGKYQHHMDDISNVLAIKACINGNQFGKGKAIIDRHYSNADNYRHHSIEVSTAMINFYGHFNDIDKAIEIFDSIPQHKRNAICYNAMMNAYCDNNLNNECIQLFKSMQDVMKPNSLSYTIVLKACTQGMAFYFGRRIHEDLQQRFPRFLTDISIQSVLISMYGKCGKLSICDALFDEIKSTQNDKYCTEIKLWNAMIHAHGRNGNIEQALHLFNAMKSVHFNHKALLPNRKTFTVLLNACSHSGDVDTAYRIWNSEIKDDDIKYDVFVLTPLVDCMSRKGMLDDVYTLLLRIEAKIQDRETAATLWMSVLGGCRKHKNQTMANMIFSEMKNRYHENTAYMASAALLLSNTHAAMGEFEHVDRIRNEMKVNKWKYVKGEAEIDIYGSLHRFNAGDDYKQKEEYTKIDEKLKEVFTALKTEYAFEHDLSVITKKLKETEEMEYELQRHSEKLALMYGLLTTPKEYELFINKNLRICTDCHESIKWISKIEDRQITVSDNSRIHIFKDGECSCNDYY